MGQTTSTGQPLRSGHPGGERRMDDQAKMVDETKDPKAKQVVGNVRRNAVELVRDVVKLFDLQLQLAYVDLQDFFRRTRLTLLAITICSIGLVASTPIFLMSLAQLVQRTWNLRMETALFIVGGAAALMFSLILWIAVKRLTKASRVLGRSVDEMSQNLAWLREILYKDEEGKSED
jgi:hypothetical protein